METIIDLLQSVISRTFVVVTQLWRCPKLTDQVLKSFFVKSVSSCYYASIRTELGPIHSV